MNDAAVRDLARHAGVAPHWTDYANRRHRVPLDSIRRILAALGLPCDTAEDLSHSRHVLDDTPPPALITATAGETINLPIRPMEVPSRTHLIEENGDSRELPVHCAAHGACLPPVAAVGYHTLEIGQTRTTLAIAPARCVTIEDIAPGERVWGIAAQTYGLRSAGDCGIGDMAGVAALAKAAAAQNADALALSPLHALFTADPAHCSPYSPSNRLFYNPLHADASSLFGEARVAKARAAAGLGAQARVLEASPLIDWPASSRAKMSMFRALFDDFSASELAASPATGLATDFAEFRAARGSRLEPHCLFEVLQAARLQCDAAAWNWRDWPAQWRDPGSAAVKSFAAKNQREILFHAFLQWVADKSFAATQQEAKRAGMRVGLVADLAVGMNSGGSHSWMDQDGILNDLEIGAPPDLFNTNGQNWGLTTFSPRALCRSGFAPFIETMRSCMRHAGGVRIDHAMALMRLWVTPRGAEVSNGAYLAYPINDLLRLVLLESHRHQVIAIGENLGTVPPGFTARLAAAGVYGMGVLWFERNGGSFASPAAWPSEAAAMTSTHDLPTVAGWWRGSDLETRAQSGVLADLKSAQAARGKDRKALWRAFQSAKAASGRLPNIDEGPRVADAAVKYVGETPSRLCLLPLEDALALEDQPNLPGTIDEHPNWRRRYAGDAGALLETPAIRDRLRPLHKRQRAAR